MASEEEDFSSLSIEDRLAHKSWKARVSGYEDLAKKFRKLEEDSPEYIQYSYDIKKYVTDTNAAAQEKGLDVTAAFLEFAKLDTAGKCVGDIMQGITAKCFNSRPKTKELAIQLCLLCVEVEQQETVIEELLKGFSNKNPKIATGCIVASSTIVSNFGAHVLPLKVLLKGLTAPFAHNDKNIRTEARNLSIELCKWVKADVLRVSLKDLKPVQLKELEEEWTKVVGENPRPTRYLRSKQQDQASANVDDASAVSDGDATPTPVDSQPAFDPWELMEPVDLLKKLPDEFYTNITSAKWSERKDAMVEFLEEASKVPKIKPSDYGELLTAMHKIITKDNNINCVMNAAKVVIVVAKGLRGLFEPHAKMFLTAVLEKTKEKKPAVVTVLSECADEIYKSTTLQNVHEEILETLENKNPNVKAESCLFTARCLCYCNPTTLSKPIIKVLVPSLKKRLDDTTPLVRDSACSALGTCLKILGDRALAAFFDDIEKNKMSKIQEACEKAELKVPQGKKTKAKEESKAKQPAKETAAPKKGAKADAKKEDQPKQAAAKATDKAKTNKATGARPAAKKDGAKKEGVKKEGAKKDGAKKGEDHSPHFDPEPSLSSDDLDIQVKEKVSEDILTRLSDSKWKDRLDASNELKEQIETTESQDLNAQVYIHVIMIKPGLADGNLQVMNTKFSIICHLVKNAPDWGEKCTETVLGTLAEKLGEIKLKAISTESMFLISERIQSLHFVATKVMSVCCAHKSPKVQSEGMNWMATALEEFGLQVKLPVYVNHIKNGLSSTNQTVKTASIKLLAAFAVFFGSQKAAFKSMIGDVNPNLESKIDKEIEAAGENPPSKPIRSLKAGKPDGDNESGEDNSGLVSAEDLIPRVDISDNFKGELMANLADKKDWKLRNEALQDIQGILKQNARITPNLGELPAGLKARLNDTNKNLVVITLNILGMLANNLGPLLSKIVRTLLPPILTVLSDAKANVREAGIAALNSWSEQLKFSAFFDFEMILSALKVDNPNQRAEIMGWVSDKLKDVNQKQFPKQELLALVVPIGSSLEDRAAPVREKSKVLLMALVDCFGKDLVTKASSKAPGQALKQILGKLAPQASVQVEKHVESKATSSEPQTAAKGKDKESSAPKKNSANAPAAPSEPEEVKPFRMGPTRDQREIEEKKHGTLKIPKWDFDQPSSDHVRYLKVHFEKCMDPALVDKLFDNDVQHQDKALKFIAGPSCLRGAFEKEIITCVDLFFKYIAMKLTEKNNTKILKSSLEFLRALLEVLSENNYVMNDFEANAIIPFLVQRMGNPNETLRKEVRFLIQNFCQIHSPLKMYTLISVGLISRNSKLKVDCIEVLGELIRDQGTGVCTPTPQRAIETIARSISDSDHKTKSAALSCMVYVYKHVGDTLFKFVGNLPQKDKELLQDKIRKLPVSSSPPPAPKTDHQPVETQEIKEEVQAKSNENINEQVEIPNQEEPEVNLPTNEDSVPPQNMPAQPPVDPQPMPTVPTQHVPQRTIPKPSAGPFSVDVEAICKKHELKPTTPLSMLKRPSGYENILKKPTNTTNYQTSTLYARTKYADDLHAIINNLASSDLSKVDENNRKLEQIIKLQPFKLVDHVESLIEASLLQMNTFISKLASRDTPEQLISVLRGILSCLISVIGIKVLCKNIKRKNLTDLFKNLAVFISNAALNDFEEGVQIIRALNILTAKLLESIDQNELFSVLLELMLQSLTQDASPTVYTEIYMKCLWRLIRNLSEQIPSIHINKLLFDVDQFFIAYARLDQSANDDKPYKTAKTIVYHVANALGQDIWNYTDMLWQREHSQVSVIIRKTLDKLNKTHDGGNVTYQNSDVSLGISTLKADLGTESSDSEMTPASRLRAQLNQGMDSSVEISTDSHEVHTRLAEIFTRIGSRDISRQGLADLYDFMVANPTTDLRPFLRSTSNIFQGYIERGLADIERERRNPFNSNSQSFHSHDIDIRNSYKQLREKAQRVMDLELPSPPRKLQPESSKFSVNTPRGEYKPNSAAQSLAPQERISQQISPQGPQKKTAPKDFSHLKKRLEMASASGPTASTRNPGTSGSTANPDKMTELRDRLSRIQQNNI